MKAGNDKYPLLLFLAALSMLASLVKDSIEIAENIMVTQNTFIIISIVLIFIAILPWLDEKCKALQPESKWRAIEGNLSQHTAIQSSGSREVEQVERYHELDNELPNLLQRLLKVHIRLPADPSIMREFRQEIRQAVADRDKDAVMEIVNRYSNSLIDNG